MTADRTGLELPALVWPSSTAREWTAAFVAAAGEDPNLVSVVAVGSAARPVAVAGDLDLVVIVRSVAAAPRPPSPDIDVVAYRAAAVRSLLGAGRDLLCAALRQGRVLHDTDDFWAGVRRRWRGREPWPSASSAEERAARAWRYCRELDALGDTEAAAEQARACLTQWARAALLRHRVFPASRPELPGQLRSIAGRALADALERLLAGGLLDEELWALMRRYALPSAA